LTGKSSGPLRRRHISKSIFIMFDI
jgi:hypothetical protein